MGNAMSRYLAASIALLALTVSAHAQPTPIAELLDIESELNSMCRGWSGDSEHTDQVCAVRTKADLLLNKLGYCHGKKGQAGYQQTWHKCTKDSNR
jgi:hypothetical protein